MRGTVLDYAIQPEERERLAARLGRIASQHGIPIQTCGDNILWPQYGMGTSACTTLKMLGEANGVEFRRLKHRGQRAGCGCFETRQNTSVHEAFGGDFDVDAMVLSITSA